MTIPWPFRAYNRRTIGVIHMRYLVLSTVLLSSVCLCSPSLIAQAGGGGGRGGGGGGVKIAPPRPTFPNIYSTPRTFFIRGKVVLDNGDPLSEPVRLQTICQGRLHTEGYTDSKGHFSFEVGSRNGGSGVPEADDSDPILRGGVSQSSMQRDWKNCELQAVLSGFTSQVVDIGSRVQDFTSADIGTITLHRLAQVQGFTISATSAAAPDKARKDYEKGLELEKKQKWDEALGKFQKAVDQYPRYAAAFFEMGQMQLRKSDLPAAQTAYRQAIAADAKFISPYQMLAEIALQQRGWAELAETSGEVVRLNPVNFPQYWLYNGTAHFQLKHYDEAEKSVLQGLHVDTEHRFPKLEHLMGVLLATKRDFAGAAEHIETYLRLAPRATDAQFARSQVEEFRKRALQASK